MEHISLSVTTDDLVFANSVETKMEGLVTQMPSYEFWSSALTHSPLLIIPTTNPPGVAVDFCPTGRETLPSTLYPGGQPEAP